MKLTNEQKELIIEGLKENLEHYKNLEVHKKEHPRGEPCSICEKYKEIIKILNRRLYEIQTITI